LAEDGEAGRGCGEADAGQRAWADARIMIPRRFGSAAPFAVSGGLKRGRIRGQDDRSAQ
jgi:hypothetical protein